MVEVQSIIDNGPEEKDVVKIKEAQLIEYKENLKKNKYWISGLKSTDYNKMNRWKMVGASKDIDAISAKNNQAVAKKYLSKRHILVVFYSEDKE